MNSMTSPDSAPLPDTAPNAGPSFASLPLPPAMLANLQQLGYSA